MTDAAADGEGASAEPVALDRIERTLPDAVKLMVANMVLAWAAYDHSVTHATAGILNSFGVPTDVGSIFLGSMDTRNKLDRIKVLLTHHGVKSPALDQLLKDHVEHVEVRNAVCHRWCIGLTPEEPRRLALASLKHRKGEPGTVDVLFLLPSELRRATAFCVNAGDFMRTFAETWRAPPR